MRAEVVIEEGHRRVFASVLGWEGWCRSGRTADGALAALEAYVPRYAPVAERAGLRFEKRWTFSVRERLEGNATTDFGAPAMVAAFELLADAEGACSRRAALVEAAWHLLDEVASKAPAALAKGPRGGGRDTDAVVGHVEAAEFAYARKIGVRERETAANRAGILGVLSAPAGPFPAGESGWPVAYGARRIAWHVLDHAWEIEDRSS